MIVEAREKFTLDDETFWVKLTSEMRLLNSTEVRTVDPALNPQLRDIPYTSFQEHNTDPDKLLEAVSNLPIISHDTHYYLVAVTEDEIRYLRESGLKFHFLGIDLSDETLTSSVLNCGPWNGELEKFVRITTPFGLLPDLQTALEAQRSLPEAWGEEEPHAWTTAWHVYELSPTSKEALRTCG